MKRIASVIFASLLTFALSAGCAHAGQQTPTPSLSCQTPSATVVYTPLNPTTSTTNPPVSVMNYSDQAPTGSWCYVVATDSGGGISQPSNVAGPFTLTVNQETNLTWSMPAGVSTTGDSWTISRIAATSVFPTAPTLNTSPTITTATLEKTRGDTSKQLASNLSSPIKLVVTIRQK